MPDAVLIAGANGAGKTTFARRLLPLSYPGCVFFNGDEIQRGGPPFATHTASGREMWRRLMLRATIPASFAVETTLSALTYAPHIARWRRQGFTVSLYFLEAVSADFAVARVAHRVANGGHGIPEPVIRRRHARGLVLLPGYQAMVDAWYHFRVGPKGSVLVARKDADPKTPRAKPGSKAAQAIEAMRLATLDATTGPPQLRAGRFTPQRKR